MRTQLIKKINKMNKKGFAYKHVCTLKQLIYTMYSHFPSSNKELNKKKQNSNILLTLEYKMMSEFLKIKRYLL